MTMSKWFQFGENRLSGSIPDAWRNLSTIEGLNWQNTKILPGLLSNVLSELFNTFPLLNDIGLGTETSGTIPAISPRMEALTELWLPNTNISGTLPANITTMTRLSKFDLQGTKIAGPLPDADLPLLIKCTFNATYDTGAIAVIKEDPTCNGKIASNGTDVVPNRCAYDSQEEVFKVRCCSDGGPNSYGSDCPLGGDPQYCPPRFKCPAGSEGRPIILSSLRLCLTPPENRCVLCPLGRFKENDTVKDADIDTCSVCPVGTYAGSQGAVTCELCPAGTYNPLTQCTSVKNCHACPIGTKGSPAGSSSIDACGPCAAGQYFDAPTGSCSDCASGRFGETPGLTSIACTGDCPSGTASDKGKTACTLCDAAKFSKKSGKSGSTLRENCAYCSNSFGKGFTSDAGADTCACSRDLYLDPTVCPTNSTPPCGNCTECPKGTLCDKVGATLADLPLTPGYWRAGPHTAKVLACPQKKACVQRRANSTGNNTSTMNATNTTTNITTNTIMTCLPGNHGVLCAVCDPNYARYGSTKPCEKCSSPTMAWVWAIIAAILIAVVLTLVMIANRKSPTGLLRPIIDLTHRLTVMLMFSAEWPSSLRAVGNAISGMMGGNIIEFVSPACIGIGGTFYSRFGLTVGVLGGVIAGIWSKVMYTICKDNRNRKKNEGQGDAAVIPSAEEKVAEGGDRGRERRMAAILSAGQDTIIMVLLMYPGVSGHAMQFFRCRNIDGRLWSDPKRVDYMMVDYGLKCYDGSWYGMLVLAVLVLIFLAIGSPALMTGLLYKKRHKIKAEAEEEEAKVARALLPGAAANEDDANEGDGGETKNTNGDKKTKTLSVDPLSILYLPYRPEVYYYEPIKMLFKIALWCALVLFSEGSEMQLGLGLIINTFQLVVHIYLLPLRGSESTPEWLMNMLETGSLVTICFRTYHTRVSHILT